MLTLEKFVSSLQLQDNRALVGLSGGPNSMALLHMLVNTTDISLMAIHVNYGCSPNADKWEKLCEEYCAQLNVPFKAYRVNVGPRNFEAKARDERFKIFSNSDFSKNVFLAHHLDDQVETFFLKLKRGGGLRGLKAMNRISKVGDLVIIRPLLSYSLSQIMDYVKKNNIPYVIDESNNDLKYDRNFIRHQIIPLFESRFPGFRKTMEKTIFSLNDSKFCLDDLAEMDLKEVLMEDGRISIPKISKFAVQRIRNMLQYYLNNKNFSTSYNDLISFSNALQSMQDKYDKHIEMSLRSRTSDKRYVLRQEGKYLSIVEAQNRQQNRKNNKSK